MIIQERAETYLAHYGTPRKSGRYPWGSGGQVNESKRNKEFLDYVAEMKAQGLTPAEIARGAGMSTTDFRALNSIVKNQVRAERIAHATALKDKGMSNVEIGKKMNLNESSVRSLLADGAADKFDQTQTIAQQLKDAVDKGKYIQIGTGVEQHMGVTADRLKVAVAMLEQQGYVKHTVQVDQLGTAPGNKTLIKVLTPPGTTYKDVNTNLTKIDTVKSFSEDGGRSFLGMHYPISIDSKRVAVNYAEDGGGKADGVLYVRPGVPDLTLDKARYAQVRVMVDGSHYLKGMAMYRDDLPPGTDIVFNTNKKKSELGPNKLEAMKPLKRVKETGEIDKDNPFGSVVRQIGPRDERGNLLSLDSAMNLVNEEGDWESWKNTISSQVLSKQSPVLAKTQLNKTFEDKRRQLDEIKQLTNPAVKKKLLDSFASDADASAVHLKAAALPRQGSHVILPIKSIKETEIYAPNFNQGEKVALIRYPHGGTFEIPELVVNNNHRESKRLLGRARDAVGINSKVAERLSGADFDGDTVLVIPNDSGKIKTQPALEGLKKFDPQHAYPGYPGMKVMDAQTKGLEMGKVSNLITDMTIGGANTQELAQAVRHSMVVIDAEKHGLNWKQSEINNGIKALQEKYQPREKGPSGGASTLISRATSPKVVNKRKAATTAKGGPIDKATGKKNFEELAPYERRTVNKKTGEVTTKLVFRKQFSTKLAETDDAHTLSSGTPIESVYAEHSNKLKALGNEARRELVATPNLKQSKSAKSTYADEVKSLDAKVNLAFENRPRERQAQIVANTWLAEKKAANPDMDKAEEKKIRYQTLKEARDRMDARKVQVEITPREWEAIQAGAISNSRLNDILNNTDLERVKELATPKVKKLMTSSKIQAALQMQARGLTQADIANALGVSLTTLKEELK